MLQYNATSIMEMYMYGALDPLLRGNFLKAAHFPREPSSHEMHVTLQSSSSDS